MDFLFTLLSKPVMSESALERIKNFAYPFIKSDLCIRLDEEVKLNFINKKGVEIGGPSNFFKRNYPIYQLISQLDIVNFSEETLWQNKKKVFYFGRKSADIIIQDAINLKEINAQEYEFLLSSNCLEHIANPLKALKEWIRIVKKDCPIVLVLPKKENNFDHRRDVTSFDHILEDFKNDTTEEDLTALEEILSLHDFSRDPGSGGPENFKQRALRNISNRAIHHHVYDLELLNKIIEFLGKEVIYQNENRIDYLIIFKN